MFMQMRVDLLRFLRVPPAGLDDLIFFFKFNSIKVRLICILLTGEASGWATASSGKVSDRRGTWAPAMDDGEHQPQSTAPSSASGSTPRRSLAAIFGPSSKTPRRAKTPSVVITDETTILVTHFRPSNMAAKNMQMNCSVSMNFHRIFKLSGEVICINESICIREHGDVIYVKERWEWIEFRGHGVFLFF